MRISQGFQSLPQSSIIALELYVIFFVERLACTHCEIRLPCRLLSTFLPSTNFSRELSAQVYDGISEFNDSIGQAFNILLLLRLFSFELIHEVIDGDHLSSELLVLAFNSG